MLKKLIIFLIVTRIALFVYAGSVVHFAGNWDGSHYIYISQHGYTNIGDEANFIVFLPLYPAIIGVVNLIIGNSPLASILVSNILFVFAGIIFYKLLKQHYSEKFSVFVVVLMAIFPTSYFFSSSYPESLFVLLFCISFYFLDKNFVALSGLAGALLTLTRPFGVLVWPALGIESLKPKKISRIAVLIIFAVLSISSYMKKPGEYDRFAKCLTEKGTVIYGNDYCQYTNKQLNFFGKSAKYLNYVKCAENQKLCDDKNIETTPLNYCEKCGEPSREKICRMCGMIEKD